MPTSPWPRYHKSLFLHRRNLKMYTSYKRITSFVVLFGPVVKSSSTLSSNNAQHVFSKLASRKTGSWSWNECGVSIVFSCNSWYYTYTQWMLCECVVKPLYPPLYTLRMHWLYNLHIPPYQWMQEFSPRTTRTINLLVCYHIPSKYNKCTNTLSHPVQVQRM